MKAMVLAAGAATGLYPLTYTLPAALIPIANRPVIEHLLRWLGSHQVEQVVINLHYLHRAVTAVLADESFCHEPGIPQCHLTVESELSGTAGGVRLAREHFSDTFCVVGTDCLTNLNLSAMLEFHRERGALCTIAALPVRSGRRFGLMETSADNRVLRFVEKPVTNDSALNWLNTGIYILEPEIFDHIPDVQPFDFAQHLFPSLVGDQGRVYAYTQSQDEEVYWQDIGEPLAYRQAHRDLLHHESFLTLPGNEIRPQIFVNARVSISDEAILIPPILLGTGVVIEAGVRIEGPVVLGDGVRVGAGARVSDSVIWSHTSLEPGTEVISSLVGSSCHLESGRQFSGVLLASGARLERKSISSD